MLEETAPAGTDTTPLCLYTPGEAGRIFEEATRLERPLWSMDDREVAEFFKRFGWETVGPFPF